MPDLFANNDEGLTRFLGGFEHGFVDSGNCNVLAFTNAANAQHSVAQPFNGPTFDNE